MTKSAIGLVAALALTLSGSAPGLALPVSAQDSAPTATAMASVGRQFLGATPADRRSWGHVAFEDAERFNWAYTPVARSGFPLREMTPEQRDLAWALVGAGLGERGRLQARQIVTLERILFDGSGGNAMRDPGNYFVSLFGVPGRVGRWGWRFEGHHLSLNFTLLDGRVVGTTPAFFGGNPATVTDGPHAGLRPFGPEEDRARELLAGLDEAARDEAVFSATAPRDIVTANHPVAARPPLLGIRLGDMNETSRERLRALIRLFAARLEPTLAAAELATLQADGEEEIRFAWAGATAPGEPHYYRIQGAGFLIEYDNTQSNANHVHTVWRNFERDFGRDPLRRHIAAAHRPGSPHADDHDH